MKKVYSFTQSVMNGTLTMETSVALFATRELAEQTLADIKADNAKYQYSEWEADGKGFNEGFAEINFGGGAMMRLPIKYRVVAWRPLADVINELNDHGIIKKEN